MSTDGSPGKPVVGWREWVVLPAVCADPIKAKVDTGARTSALHAFDLEIRDGIAHFAVHPHQNDDETVVETSHPVLELREVRSSNGSVEERPVIRLDAVVGGTAHRIDLTLTNRDEMGFRMLLGRTALGDFLVDPSRSYLQGGRPRGLEA